MLFVLDRRVEERAGGGVAELDPDAPRVRPVARVQLVGLEGEGERVRVAGGLDGGEEVVGEGGGGGEVGRHAPAGVVAAGRVEVEGVEGYEGFEGFFGGGGGGLAEGWGGGGGGRGRWAEGGVVVVVRGGWGDVGG